jgi:hypothetical protein
MKPEEEQRLKEYFRKLASLIPNPPKDWKKNAKPCKWDKILKEQQAKSDVPRGQ